jgi:predicted Zn-dependent protease
MEKENGSGYAAAEGRTLAETRVEETARRAAQKAHIAQNPRRVEAQPMMVVLEPVAAAELLEMFLHGFSALTYQEGRSFVCDTLGEQVCAPVLSITDDGLDERTYVMPFDYEGVPRQRVELVREGVINNLVYDTYTAGREKPPRRSTGHAMPPPAPWGPYPCNCIVRPGDGTLEDLVATVDKGLLVSRVHYLNLVHPRKMILTGMTRDGTFLIENGNILCGVRNLRFTERFVEALGRLVAVGQNGELHENIWTPSLVIDNFCFTSETEF